MDIRGLLFEPTAQQPVEAEQRSGAGSSDLGAGGLHREQGLARTSRGGEENGPIVGHRIKSVVLLIQKALQLTLAVAAHISWDRGDLKPRAKNRGDAARRCHVWTAGVITRCGQTSGQVDPARCEYTKDGAGRIRDQILPVEDLPAMPLRRSRSTSACSHMGEPDSTDQRYLVQIDPPCQVVTDAVHSVRCLLEWASRRGWG